GDAGDRVQWGEPGAVPQPLGLAFEHHRHFLAEQHADGRRVHLFAEPDVSAAMDPASPVDRVVAYLSYEAICNQVYAPYDCPVTCLWDSRRHPTSIIDNVRSLHNHEITEAGSVVNAGYVPPVAYLAGRNDSTLPS